MKSEKGFGNPLLIAAVLAVILILAFGAFKTLTNKPTPTGNVETAATPTATQSAPLAETALRTKEFTINASNFTYSPNMIKVKKGDTVKITLKNTGGMHDIVFEGYNASTKAIGSGKSEELSFVADKAGTFKYFCSIGNHRAMGMEGTLVVE